MEIPKHKIDYLISSCRAHADVLNMSYICAKKNLQARYMNDLVVRKKPHKDATKILSLIDGILEYCDEVDNLRSKIERLRDEINSQDKG
jgi:hypothetical protein